MKSIRGLKIYREIALFMAAAFLCVGMLAVFYVAMETGHECHGEECSVCACMEICESFIRQVGTAFPVLMAGVVYALAVLVVILPLTDGVYGRTPVDQKIRLND
ncbi:MAG: hypothetical protein K6F00_09035 [Lachnospiraceae bacterium]|nr:hypothetical protein [Lachnospiraceae bacterium]